MLSVKLKVGSMRVNYEWIIWKLSGNRLKKKERNRIYFLSNL